VNQSAESILPPDRGKRDADFTAEERAERLMEVREHLRAFLLPWATQQHDPTGDESA
jgi:hypothetical protein